MFLLPILALSALAALYGRGYLGAYRGRTAAGAAWLFFNLLVASMALVVLARNGVLFLVAWEVMALASFFLVMFEDEQRGVRDGGLDLPGRHAPRHGVPARAVRPARAARAARSTSTAFGAAGAARRAGARASSSCSR